MLTFCTGIELIATEHTVYIFVIYYSQDNRTRMVFKYEYYTNIILFYHEHENTFKLDKTALLQDCTMLALS